MLLTVPHTRHEKGKPYFSLFTCLVCSASFASPMSALYRPFGFHKGCYRGFKPFKSFGTSRVLGLLVLGLAAVGLLGLRAPLVSDT